MTAATDPSDRFLQCGFSPSNDRDDRALSREIDHSSLPDSGAASGNEDRFSFE